MAVLKCKMCGGDLNVTEESNVAECEFCGTTQTVLMPDNEKKTNLYNRANRLRFANEFDKAIGVFESLVAEFPEEAEAYWGLCLCKYGIEYVDDPATGKKIPTCHRTSYESIFDDPNFELALEYADSVAKSIYREEAKSIDRIQRGILEIADKEEPFDIFICYKETDDKGERTIDSVLAQEIYNELTEKGYRVFFSRITLEDKLGQEYEPYIFSALNSAKIMLVIGTKYEYFEAVWVKNEWGRFIDLMKTDKDKTLIPCYRDIDAYDMPREFKNLQGQDMGKLGYQQDLIRGISKILGYKDYQKEEYRTNLSTTQTSGALTRRGQIYLEDGEFKQAYDYFDKALNENPEDSEAYFGKFMSSIKISDIEKLKKLSIQSLHNYKDFERALRFADNTMRNKLNEIQNCVEINYSRLLFINIIKDYTKKQQQVLAQKESLYNKASEILLNNSDKISDYEIAKEIFEKLDNFKDSKEKVEYCNNKIEEIKPKAEKIYNEAVDLYNSGNYKEAAFKFFKCENIKDTLKYLTNIFKNNVSIACGNNHIVGLKIDGTVVAAGDNKCGQCNVSDWKNIISIASGRHHTAGLKKDGTVIATGDNSYGQCNVSGWKDIVSIACGSTHTVGLKIDGTVVATGYNKYEQCDVSGWKDIVYIVCSGYNTVGLKTDGTVVATGDNKKGQCDVSGWKDIVYITCGDNYTAGLKTDGTVVTTRDRDVSGWKDIVFIACGGYHKAGLKRDGTVVGSSCVSDWKGIVSIACGGWHTVGLKSDGTVAVAGYNEDGRCNVSDWKDIVYIACGNNYTVGLKSDGTVVATGENKEGQCDVSKWNNIDHFINVKKFFEIKESIKNIAKERTGKVKEKIKDLEEVIRNKNEYKNKLNEQLEEIDKEINDINSKLQNIGLALFGQKAAMKKELNDKLASLNKNKQDINAELSQAERDLTILQKEVAVNHDLL